MSERPWKSETLAPPQRFKGLRVICSDRRLTEAHVFKVVIEVSANSADFYVGLLVYGPDKQWQLVDRSAAMPYREARAAWRAAFDE